jgi:succinylglutamate desuccinylase
MKICTSDVQPTILAIVCCQHGNERFGLTIFEYISLHLTDFPGAKLILANEPAVEQNIRFIESDLNRSFPGSPNGTKEERLANELLREVANIPYLLDIHTTTSDIRMVPILTSLNDQTKHIINLTSSREVVLIEPPLSGHSLIGNISAGVSLEFGNLFSETQTALQETLSIIQGILHSTHVNPSPRELFRVDGNIPKSTPIPTDAANFKNIDSLGVYPILLHEAAYTNLHALSATQMETILI